MALVVDITQQESFARQEMLDIDPLDHLIESTQDGAEYLGLKIGQQLFSVFIGIEYFPDFLSHDTNDDLKRDALFILWKLLKFKKNRIVLISHFESASNLVFCLLDCLEDCGPELKLLALRCLNLLAETEPIADEIEHAEAVEVVLQYVKPEYDLDEEVTRSCLQCLANFLLFNRTSIEEIVLSDKFLRITQNLFKSVDSRTQHDVLRIYEILTRKIPNQLILEKKDAIFHTYQCISSGSLPVRREALRILYNCSGTMDIWDQIVEKGALSYLAKRSGNQDYDHEYSLLALGVLRNLGKSTAISTIIGDYKLLEWIMGLLRYSEEPHSKLEKVTELRREVLMTLHSLSVVEKNKNRLFALGILTFADSCLIQKKDTTLKGLALDLLNNLCNTFESADRVCGGGQIVENLLGILQYGEPPTIYKTIRVFLTMAQSGNDVQGRIGMQGFWFLNKMKRNPTNSKIKTVVDKLFQLFEEPQKAKFGVNDPDRDMQTVNLRRKIVQGSTPYNFDVDFTEKEVPQDYAARREGVSNAFSNKQETEEIGKSFNYGKEQALPKVKRQSRSVTPVKQRTNSGHISADVLPNRDHLHFTPSPEKPRRLKPDTLFMTTGRKTIDPEIRSLPRLNNSKNAIKLVKYGDTPKENRDISPHRIFARGPVVHKDLNLTPSHVPIKKIDHETGNASFSNRSPGIDDSLSFDRRNRSTIGHGGRQSGVGRSPHLIRQKASLGMEYSRGKDILHREIRAPAPGEVKFSRQDFRNIDNFLRENSLPALNEEELLESYNIAISLISKECCDVSLIDKEDEQSKAARTMLSFGMVEARAICKVSDKLTINEVVTWYFQTGDLRGQSKLTGKLQYALGSLHHTSKFASILMQVMFNESMTNKINKLLGR